MQISSAQQPIELEGSGEDLVGTTAVLGKIETNPSGETRETTLKRELAGRIRKRGIEDDEEKINTIATNTCTLILGRSNAILSPNMVASVGNGLNARKQKKKTAQEAFLRGTGLRGKKIEIDSHLVATFIEEDLNTDTILMHREQVADAVLCLLNSNDERDLVEIDQAIDLCLKLDANTEPFPYEKQKTIEPFPDKQATQEPAFLHRKQKKKYAEYEASLPDGETIDMEKYCETVEKDIAENNYQAMVNHRHILEEMIDTFYGNNLELKTRLQENRDAIETKLQEFLDEVTQKDDKIYKVLITLPKLEGKKIEEILAEIDIDDVITKWERQKELFPEYRFACEAYIFRLIFNRTVGRAKVIADKEATYVHLFGEKYPLYPDEKLIMDYVNDDEDLITELERIKTMLDTATKKEIRKIPSDEKTSEYYIEDSAEYEPIAGDGVNKLKNLVRIYARIMGGGAKVMEQLKPHLSMGTDMEISPEITWQRAEIKLIKIASDANEGTLFRGIPEEETDQDEWLTGIIDVFRKNHETYVKHLHQKDQKGYDGMSLEERYVAEGRCVIFAKEIFKAWKVYIEKNPKQKHQYSLCEKFYDELMTMFPTSAGIASVGSAMLLKIAETSAAQETKDENQQVTRIKKLPIYGKIKSAKSLLARGKTSPFFFPKTQQKDLSQDYKKALTDYAYFLRRFGETFELNSLLQMRGRELAPSDLTLLKSNTPTMRTLRDLLAATSR